MKIRHKLLLSFSLYMLLAVILGIIAFKEITTISKRLTLVETADDITNSLLEVRRYEKNYLLYREQLNFTNLKKYIGILKENIGNIRMEIIRDIGDDNYDMMKQSLAEYERLVERIYRNFASQRETEALVRERSRAVERAIDGELQAFLALRRHEKNIMLYKTEEARQAFAAALNASTLRKRTDVESYSILVEKLSALYRDEKEAIELMRQAARKIQSFTENLSKKERADIDAILTRATTLLIVTIIVVVAVGSIVNVKIAEGIATPLKKLENISRKVAAGDFSERIEVKGKDELASLQAAFNYMEERLQNALWSLEQAVENLREKQARLVEAEKLAAVGKLAAGIAHEINNPLTSVLTFSNLMLEQCPKDDPWFEKLRLMARETERARNIVRQILNFGRENIIKPERININRPVSEIIDSLNAQGAFDGIELKTDLSDTLPDAHVDPAQIGQVVLNMLLNAIHAITPPGVIDVVTRSNGRFVELIIADSGKGIPPEHLTKIFDPFFTTKDMTKGTGLGLAVSYGIIKKHGGDIEVQSTEGKGTTFTVRLPIHG